MAKLCNESVKNVTFYGVTRCGANYTYNIIIDNIVGPIIRTGSEFKLLFLYYGSILFY